MVVQVGDDEDEFGMFRETVGQLFEGLPHVFDADLLANNQPWDVGECLMHFPKKFAQHRAVTHTGIKDTEG